MLNPPFLHMNPASIREAVGDSPKMLVRVATIASSTLRKQLHECNCALLDEDKRAWQHAVHGLRGSLRVLGAQRALAQLQHIETLEAPAGNAPAGLLELGGMIDLIEDELQRLVENDPAAGDGVQQGMRDCVS